ncbi:MAG: hypothetical protein ACYSUI_13125, partial [Planctomycetota bacterium]
TLGTHALTTIATAIKGLGIDPELETNPAITRTLLRQMKLWDFEPHYEPMRRFLTTARSEPQPLGTLLRSIAEGIAERHPAIVQFLDRANQEDWLSPGQQVQESVHLAYLLEALTVAMANSNDFVGELQAHFLRVRRTYGIKTTSALHTLWKVWRRTGSLFAATKTISVDPAITRYSLIRGAGGQSPSRQTVSKLMREGKLTYVEKKFIMPKARRPAGPSLAGLRLNVYEAGNTEFKKGFEANAVCVYALAKSLDEYPYTESFGRGAVLPTLGRTAFHDSVADPSNIYSINGLSQDWVSLYNSWNMAFILSELDDLHLLFPKLLIPSVLCALPENYLYTRILSLWVCVNLFLFRRLDRGARECGPSARRAMAHAWGEINREHAVAYAERKLHKGRAEFFTEFEKRFTWPTLKLIGLMASI